MGQLTNLYVTNPFTGIVDYNSARNPDHFNDYRKLFSKVCYLPVIIIKWECIIPF